jgi:HD-GYP domain-containing protein (c-di-GMP phosphodiesterase class II)
VEAMASHRPYRAALGVEVALKEIMTFRGVLYDDLAVGACLSVFTESGFDFESMMQTELAHRTGDSKAAAERADDGATPCRP